MFCVFIILASQYCLVINIDDFRLLQFFILQRWLPHKINFPWKSMGTISNALYHFSFIVEILVSFGSSPRVIIPYVAIVYNDGGLPIGFMVAYTEHTSHRTGRGAYSFAACTTFLYHKLSIALYGLRLFHLFPDPPLILALAS